MPKAGELQWDDLMKGNVGEPEHPLSRPVEARLPLNKTVRPAPPSNEEIAKEVLRGAPRQPTDQELFGHLVVSEEQVKKAQKSWDNTFNSYFDQLKKPIEDQSSIENRNWGQRGSILKDLPEEERVKRNMHTAGDALGE